MSGEDNLATDFIIARSDDNDTRLSSKDNRGLIVQGVLGIYGVWESEDATTL